MWQFPKKGVFIPELYSIHRNVSIAARQKAQPSNVPTSGQIITNKEKNAKNAHFIEDSILFCILMDKKCISTDCTIKTFQLLQIPLFIRTSA